jgi:phage gpG-like protein
MLRVDLKLPEEFLRYMNTLPRHFNKAVLRGLKLGMKVVEGKAKRSFGEARKPGIGTGRLRASIQSSARREGAGFAGRIGSDLVYASIHEFGGVIRPRASEYMTFQTAEGWRRVKQVVMPRRPYIQPAIIESLDDITKLIYKEVRRATK